MLEVREIAIDFGGVKAVDGVSFGARRGEVTGLIGPNGAGKTTVFDILSGFLMPRKGLISLDGTILVDGGTESGGRARQPVRSVPPRVRWGLATGNAVSGMIAGA